MSELDVRLDWDEEREREVRGDGYDVAAGASAAAVQVVPQEAEAPASEEDEFEYSEERARNIEQALERLQGVFRPPVVAYLREALEHPEETRLKSAEAWLESRLAEWEEVKRVEPEDDSDEARSRAEKFNEALSAGSDALHLCQEIVQQIRSGQLSVAERLLDQVEEFLTRSQQAMLAVG